jgi:preprotein translocase subunit SecE
MAQEVRENVELKETKEVTELKQVKLSKNTKPAKPKKDFKKFFIEIKGELKKVIWPGRTQLINNTLTVLLACVFVGAIIWVADIGFEKVYKVVFGR